MNRIVTVLGIVLLVLAVVLYFVANITNEGVVILGVVGLLGAIIGVARGL